MLRRLTFVLTMLASACGGDSQSTPESAPRPSNGTPATPTEEPTHTDPCESARRCCPEFNGIMGRQPSSQMFHFDCEPGVAAAAAEGEAACQEMLDAWRAELVRLNEDVPTACR